MISEAAARPAWETENTGRKSRVIDLRSPACPRSFREMLEDAVSRRGHGRDKKADCPAAAEGSGKVSRITQLERRASSRPFRRGETRGGVLLPGCQGRAKAMLTPRGRAYPVEGCWLTSGSPNPKWSHRSPGAVVHGRLQLVMQDSPGGRLGENLLGRRREGEERWDMSGHGIVIFIDSHTHAGSAQ